MEALNLAAKAVLLVFVVAMGNAVCAVFLVLVQVGWEEVGLGITIFFFASLSLFGLIVVAWVLAKAGVFGKSEEWV